MGALLVDGFWVGLADRADLGAIVEIYNENVLGRQATADLVPVSVESRVGWFLDHDAAVGRPVYVVKDAQGEVVAWGSFSDLYQRPAYHVSSEISVYVRSGFRGMGLGFLLVRFMLDQAPDLGILRVVALIFAHNQPSLALFAKLGFEYWGLLPRVCDMGDFMADVVIVGLDLTKRESDW